MEQSRAANEQPRTAIAAAMAEACAATAAAAAAASTPMETQSSRLSTRAPESVGARRHRGQPYDWIWDADDEMVNALLNFVEYDGPPFQTFAHAVHALTSDGVFGHESGAMRQRLGAGRHRIKRSGFCDLVRHGMRWKKRKSPYEYFRHVKDAPAPAPAPAAEAPQLAPAPPKPVAPPAPGPRPTKPKGERYATQHPFSQFQITQAHNVLEVSHHTSLKDVILNRFVSFPRFQEPKLRTYMCMWQVATLVNPKEPHVAVHHWVTKLCLSLQWRGERVCAVPRFGYTNQYLNVIEQAMDDEIRIFAPLDGRSVPECVTDAQATEYNAQYERFLKAKAAQVAHERALKKYEECYGIPNAPDPEECVATGKVTTWEERDLALREQAVCLDD
jgi:hypothetical protein